MLISRRNRSRAEGLGELGAEDLDGDEAVVLQVAGEVDGGHPAVAELPLDVVSGGERAQPSQDHVGHGLLPRP